MKLTIGSKGSDCDVEFDVMTIGETLNAVTAQQVRLENHGGQLRIRSAVDVKLEQSIHAHARTLLSIAVPVGPEPTEAAQSQPRNDRRDNVTPRERQPEQSGTTAVQHHDNLEVMTGIKEVADVVLHLSPDEWLSFRDLIEKADSRAARWGIIRDMFQHVIEACEAGRSYRMPYDDVPF